MQRGKSSRILKMENFYPESFVLDNKADREAFFQTHKGEVDSRGKQDVLSIVLESL